MARRQIEDAYYIFNPANNTITIPRIVRQDRLMLITNTTAGTVIYNFADPNINAYSFVVDNEVGYEPTTTITLKYNCNGMNANDELAIIVDEVAETVTFTEPLLDAVNKLRVSPPQSLIDTDFEYGVQGSKWEALVLTANYPSFFSRATGGNSFDLTSMVGDGVSPRSTVTVVVTSPATDLLAGDVISVQDSANPLAEGTYPVETVSTDGFTFTYKASGVVSGNLRDGTLTAVTGGGIYDNAHIPGGNAAVGLNGWSAYSDEATESTITVTTSNPHGLLPGTPILIGTQNPACPIIGTWRIFNVSSPNQFKFKMTTTVMNASMVTSGSGLYAKPNGYVQHRPYDGGVLLSTTDNVCGVRVIRQTRRYFRYQSGKAMQFSTGVKFTPTFDIDTITVAGVLPGSQTVTVDTIQDHGLQPGAKVKIEGIVTAGSYNPWNGKFEVTNILGTNRFQYNMILTQSLSATDQFPGGIDVKATVYEWDGAATRTGLFNDQNGFFFEYDGTYLYAIRRFSNKELFGRLSVTQNSNVITGTGTRFRKQLLVGQSIVIKGANYTIAEISSDTRMAVTPAYRGVTNPTARYLITQEVRVPQTEWNMDRMDGTGPTGYTLDTTQMQMAYIDYTWYGAGFIRFGFRTTDGNIAYCHRMPNNNRNTEAYMRSGNLPARYEAVNSPFFNTKLKAGGNGIVGSALASSEILMYVDDITYWPNEGWLIIRDSSAVEICSYTITNPVYNETAQGYAVNINRRQPMTSYFSGVPFALSGTQNGVTFIPDSTITNGSGTPQVSVQTITNTCAPVISHWGSSVIMDGRFDDDKNFIFTAGMQRFMNIAGSGTVTAKVTSKSAAAGTATLTTASNHGLQAGYPISVSDVNTRAVITSVQRTSATSITVTTSGAHNFVAGYNVLIVNTVLSNRSVTNQVVPNAILTVLNGNRNVETTPTSNTFTVTLAGAYGYQLQSQGTSALATESATFNGQWTVSAVTSNTIQYNITHSGTVAASIVTPNGSVQQSFGSAAVPRPLISIRIAPSADNGIGRNYGIREIVNTMSAQLSSLGILAQGTFLIQGLYNVSKFPTGVNVPSDWELRRVPGGSLSQVIYHDNTGITGSTITTPQTTVLGGDQAFAFYVSGTATEYNTTTFDLTKVRDLGTSILSGNGNQSAPGFPNGPDILTIVATNLGLTSSDISARLSWTEAQA